MAKRKRKKTAKKTVKKSKNKSSNLLKYIVLILTFIALVMSVLLIWYYFSSNEINPKPIIKKNEKIEPKREMSAEKSVKTRLQDVLKKETVPKKVKKPLKEEQIKEKYISASHEIEKSLSKPPEAINRPTKLLSNKPKLAIIIDDVGSKRQVQNIKNVGLVMSMSFLPPSKYRPNTPKLAAKQNFYMVHLPMEAKNWSAEEPFTLRTDDSEAVISKRISKIKELFPKVKYINNHTGSKFTSNEVAMNRLIYALNSKGINFIDSRTTADTKAPKVMKNLGLKYVARDVFLDHHMDKAYVLSQIKQAIRVAKVHGTAIAIGHPHPNTLAALRESKKLFKGVDLVYVNKLY